MRPPALRLSPWTGTASALGVVEIFAWGSTYYLMAVLAGPMAADTGWSPGAIAAGVSVGLLVSGLSAPRVGRLIRRTGGRPVLAAGMGLIAAGLALLGLAESLPVYFAAWVVLGLGMSGGLYDAAFSTLGRLFGRDARAAITQLTLWGGFASTVCWPLSAWLVGELGWRGACLFYAALHVGVTLPICLLLLPRAPAVAPPDRDAAQPAPETPPSLLDVRLLAILATGVTFSMVSAILAIHLVTLLSAQGYQVAAAIAVGTLIGPAQVAARVGEMMGRGRHHPIWTMGAATTLVLAGVAGLVLGAPASAALIAYGAGNGLWSIARGVLPLALFGPELYAETMGRIAKPVLIAGAAAPTIGALIIDTAGPAVMLDVLAAAALVPVVAMVVLAAHLKAARPAPSI
ncbi:MFS transporter [Acuticoccus yangtzensis]|uniref:MFS transporter n=1 Tax=Acuticoccus yangtzensis TaxID=1443441 RepID=UPI0009497FA5|nr:MFS transporter [Acuticoccus yangtzensis]